MKTFNTYLGWGRVARESEVQDILWQRWRDEPLPAAPDGKFLLPRGLGRSYGDSCMNGGHCLLATAAMNRHVQFEPDRGLIVSEAGVILDDVLRLVVPRGWFVPVVPGTRFVTLGGCVANDVHGKNHHKHGTFGCHVEWLELLRSDGLRRICSPTENKELFHATIGGLGLTGLITRVALRLRRITSSFIDMESVKFSSLNEFFEVNAVSEPVFDYTVAWIDCTAGGSKLGRGHYMRGNFSSQGALVTHQSPRISVPVEFPSWALAGWSVRLFNKAYYGRQLAETVARHVHYAPFFFPLDSILGWNKIYGRRGFYQYQCVVPFDTGQEVMREMLRIIAESGQGSFLAVLKTFSDIPSPGIMSFPRPGVTLALDFPNEGERTRLLFARLDEIVLAAHGRLYPAKDALMSGATFRHCYPMWQEFATHVDPCFSSSFWRRVTGGAD